MLLLLALLIGLLSLATFRAGQWALLTVTLLGGIGTCVVLYADYRQGLVNKAAYEAAHPRAEYEALKRDCAAIRSGALDGLRLQLEFERRGCPTYLQHD